MKFSTNLFFDAGALILGGALLMNSAQAKSQFIPQSKEELEVAAANYCNGTWLGPKLRYWAVTNITNFDRLFADSADCNPDVEKWDVSGATSLEGMFANTSGFDHSLGKWDITLGADVSNFFDEACPANSSAIIDPKPLNPAGVLFDPSRKASLDSLTPYIPVVDLGELLERCACDGDLGFNNAAECVSCEEIGMHKGSKGVCVVNCPPGADNYGDSCWCTSSNEHYDKYENTCICNKGAWGLGNGTCQECPKYTDAKYKAYEGVGTVEERCECENYYEEWSPEEQMCVCSVGAYGDGNDDCDECPDGMEEKDDVGPGIGDEEDRCQCEYKGMEYDDDEDGCVCKKGYYSTTGSTDDKCYSCKKIDGAEGKSGVKEGLGDADDRCQCKDSALSISGNRCVTSSSSF